MAPKKRTRLLDRILCVTASFFAVLIAAVLAAGMPAMAGTLDGSTPANEGVCNELKLEGVTPALYGLCVAYCEAQDLDDLTTDKDPPNTKILENYNKRKRASDPEMPCLKTPCPCWEDAELASISSDGMAGACLRTTTSVQLIDNAPTTHYALADTGRSRCAYVDLNAQPPRVNFQTITPEQAQACFTAVSSACSNLGL